MVLGILFTSVISGVPSTSVAFGVPGNDLSFDRTRGSGLLAICMASTRGLCQSCDQDMEMRGRGAIGYSYVGSKECYQAMGSVLPGLW